MQAVFCLLICIAISCSSDPVNINRPFSDLIPSKYLDSLTATNKSIVISMSDSINHVIPRKRDFYSIVKRVGIDSIAPPMGILPYKACAVINDSLAAISTTRGYVRFINIKTGSIVKDFRPGMGPAEFQNPQKILNTKTHFAVYDMDRNFVEVFDETLKHVVYINLRNISNSSWNLAPIQPAFGLVSDGVYTIDDLSVDGINVVKHNFSGHVVEKFPVGTWMPDSPDALNRYGVWVNEKYLAIGSVAVPYVIVLDRQSKEILKFIAIDSIHTRNQLKYVLDPTRNITLTRAVYDVFFKDDNIVVNLYGMNVQFSLVGDSNSTILIYRNPDKTESAPFEVLNEHWITTASDTTFRIAAANHFYAPGKLMNCPAERDFIEFFELDGDR